MDIAAFRLKSYQFTRACLDFKDAKDRDLLNVDFTVQGLYNSSEGAYKLILGVFVTDSEKKANICEVNCEAMFEFNSPILLHNIPDYFYPNSIAIMFPYVRAFISTLSLQANVTPIVLPTMKLTGLSDTLKKNTLIVGNEKDCDISNARK